MAEIHFQSGFTGEPIEVRVDGVLVSSFQARTRMQVGVAHVLPLEVDADRKVTVLLPKAGLSASFHVRPSAPFVRVSLEGGQLHVEHRKEQDRYA
jgi:hypothetical protein